MKTALIALVVGLFAVSTTVYATSNSAEKSVNLAKDHKKKGHKKEKKEEEKKADEAAAAPSTEQKPAEGAPAPQGN